MTCKVTFSQKAGYLHAVATGTNTKANVMRYLEDILHECVVRNCFRVLIEERLEGPRMGTMDIFDIASQGQSRHAGMRPIIAYVDVNATNISDMKFAEDVAVNRGTFVRVFPSVADAELWIANLGGKGSPPDVPAK
jgi:hypothetical protein